MVTKNLAIAALIINIFIPGLGSLIAGKTKEGLWQLGLSIGGSILTMTMILIFVGIPMSIMAWVWGIITGVKLIQRAH